MHSDQPDTMLAIRITEPGAPDVLQPANVAVPTPSPEQVLVRVAAAGVNRPDVLQRLGKYPVPPDASPLPGLEVAGEIVALGDRVGRWRIGDRVMALTHGGGYAEFAVVHEDHCLAVPGNLSDIEAAAVPETFFTVWYNVFTRCRLARGESFLVHGGSSGIGTTAIQLAKAFDCRVLTTAGSDDKCAFCMTLGADHAINYKTEDWQAVVASLTDGRGVDVILDMVAGAYMQKNLASLALEGRYAIIAFLQDKDGNEVTVALPTDAPEPDAGAEAVAAKPAAAESPEAVIVKYGCPACHSVLQTQSEVGPSLTDVGSRLKINDIRASIIEPNAVITEGFPPIMPQFPDMTITELEMVSQFLAEQTGGAQ